MYYCIIISFTSIFEKHLTALSEHRSYHKCAKDENNAKEIMRVFYITNRVDLRVLIVHSGHFVTPLSVRFFALTMECWVMWFQYVIKRGLSTRE